MKNGEIIFFGQMLFFFLRVFWCQPALCPQCTLPSSACVPVFLTSVPGSSAPPSILFTAETNALFFRI